MSNDFYPQPSVEYVDFNENDIVSEVNVHEEDKTHLTFLSSFGGSDMTILIDNKAIGEITKIDYEEKYNHEESTGVIHAILFDRDPFQSSGVDLFNTEELTILYRNEYGQQAVRYFYGFQFTKKVGSVSVNDVIQTEQYHFTFSHTSLEPHQWEYDQKRKTYQILENNDETVDY